jgi:predicted DNA-binding transcriptional regulator AlpA
MGPPVNTPQVLSLIGMIAAATSGTPTPEVLALIDRITAAASGLPNKANPRVRLLFPEALADVALIDAKTCAAVGGMGVSWWLAEVAAGRAPQPVIRQPRCTRWTCTSVRDYWAARAEKAAADTDTASTMTRAKKASVAAQARRRARAASTEAAE